MAKKSQIALSEQGVMKGRVKSTSQAFLYPPSVMTDHSKNTNGNGLYGGVWAIEPVEVTPDVVLDEWNCFEVQLPSLPYRTRHFAGTNVHSRHGRVSSAISELDPTSRRCTTSSGRIYTVGMRNGLGPDGQYTWDQWIRINNAADIVDVTAEVESLLAGSVRRS